MLGLLVFPKEKYFEQLPLIPFNELESNGWAIPKLESGCEIKNLRELIRFLRNAITHCNLEFLSNDGSEIIGLCVWNKNKNGDITWKAKLSITDIEQITGKLLDAIQKAKIST